MNSIKQNLIAIVLGVIFIMILVPMAMGQLPDPGMKIDPSNTALVISDPQNDFLSPKGVTLGRGW